jgi:hypothetical protein
MPLVVKGDYIVDNQVVVAAPKLPKESLNDLLARAVVGKVEPRNYNTTSPTFSLSELRQKLATEIAEDEYRPKIKEIVDKPTRVNRVLTPPPVLQKTSMYLRDLMNDK